MNLTRTLFALLLTGILFLQGCFGPASSSSNIAVVRNFSGEIYYHPADSKNRIRLQAADINQRPLFPLDKIVVAKESFLHLHFNGHGDVYLEPETTLIVQKAQEDKQFEVMAKIMQGVVDCFIEKKGSRFAVQTPVAVAGVLGTSFQIKVSEEGSEFHLLESEHGLVLQNLEQTLKNPLTLKVEKANTGAYLGQSVMLVEEAVEHSAAGNTSQLELESISEADTADVAAFTSSSSPSAGLAAAAPMATKARAAKVSPAAADTAAVRSISNPTRFTFPSISKDGKVERKSFADHGARVQKLKY